MSSGQKQECWQIPYKAQDRPHSIEVSSPNVNRLLLVTRSGDWGCTSEGFRVTGSDKNGEEDGGLREEKKTRVQSLGWEDPLEEEMATYSSNLAWKITWTDEPGELQSLGFQRVRCNLATK